jgi:hypothetical protein
MPTRCKSGITSPGSAVGQRHDQRFARGAGAARRDFIRSRPDDRDATPSAKARRNRGRGTDRRRVQPDVALPEKSRSIVHCSLRDSGGSPETEYAALLAALKSTISHAVDLAEGDPHSVRSRRPAPLSSAVASSEAVGGQYKGASVAMQARSHRDEGVLQASGNDGKIVGIFSAQPKRAVRRPPQPFNARRDHGLLSIRS